ncbi:MAG: glutathione peroxidase [Flavobacteriales bacterium]
MKMTLTLLIVVALCVVAVAFVRNKNQARALRVAATPQNFYDLSYTAIDGSTVAMSTHRGKYVLCVNVASECGYTEQYADLEKLYEQYKDKLVIIGFPCNQFGGQEPGDEATVESFCKKNYGVTFPLSSKIDVKGSGQHAVYTWLTSKGANGVSDASISWNFNKILVGKNGEWLAHYGSKVLPLGAEITGMLK